MTLLLLNWVGEAERMPTIVTDVLGVSGTPGEKAHSVGGNEAPQRMADLVRSGRALQETMAAVAGVLDEAVARGDRRHTMPEQTAGIPDFLREAAAAGEPISVSRKNQRVAAPHAHVLVHAIPIGEEDVGVMPEEAAERVTDVRGGVILAEVFRAAPAVSARAS